MAVFTNDDHVYDVMEEWWTRVQADPVVIAALAGEHVSIRFVYTSPSAVLHLDTTVDPVTFLVRQGAQDAPADLVLTMSADNWHLFWQGLLNVPMAMVRRTLKVTGPVTMLTNCLDSLQKTFPIYSTLVDELDL